MLGLVCLVTEFILLPESREERPHLDEVVNRIQLVVVYNPGLFRAC